MNLNKYVPTKVSRVVARQVLSTQKNSPTILFAVGVVGVVGTVVLASRATLKLDEVLVDINKDREDAKKLHEERPEVYDDKKYKHDLTFLYMRSALQVGKLYGPSIGLGVLSIAALSGSHNILTKRNAGLSAAYAAVDKAFGEYRTRVVNEYGEDKDREFRFGTEEKTIVEEQPSGQMKKVQVKHAKDGSGSPYARFFDQYNQNWEPTPEFNLIFLKAQQNNLNDQLHRRGHVMLNDAYDALGIERSPAGSQVGWWVDTKTGESTGDGYIDFGIWKDKDLDKFHEFMIGQEKGLWLDFNVDGEIWPNI